ncbi:hypothetical protein D356_00917 [Enterococcus faecium SD2A-2]|uniref:Uncharacterized protein n=1 Tax=Enterococcus faecium SD2A-2 TaxID=1244154 RepID=A0AB73AAZ1_ENTFC|nr:hypothetical protein D356_00917 [Enterococcus faecium SD2A-2]
MSHLFIIPYFWFCFIFAYKTKEKINMGVQNTFFFCSNFNKKRKTLIFTSLSSFF